MVAAGMSPRAVVLPDTLLDPFIAVDRFMVEAWGMVRAFTLEAGAPILGGAVLDVLSTHTATILTWDTVGTPIRWTIRMRGRRKTLMIPTIRLLTVRTMDCSA